MDSKVFSSLDVLSHFGFFIIYLLLGVKQIMIDAAGFGRLCC